MRVRIIYCTNLLNSLKIDLNPTKLTLNGQMKSMPRRLKTCKILIEENGCNLVVFAHIAQTKHLET